MSDKEAPWKRFTDKKTQYIKYAQEWEKKIGSFLEFKPEKPFVPTTFECAPPKDGPLTGLPFGIKDNIALEGFKVTCGSKMLANVISPYTATAVKKLIQAGAIPVGKTNLDEFGMGSSTDNSALGKTNNPWDPARVAGGSSGGSAAAVAAGLVPFALGTDTGGSVRQPASFCGVYGLKPTYGTVSRFGMTAYASSLEVMGVLAQNIDLVQTVYDIMKGADDNDQTSLDPDPFSGKEVKTIGVLKGLSGLAPDVDKVYQNTLSELKKLGFKVIEIDLSTLDYAVPAYYTIAAAEASANLARFTGIRYGIRPDYAENPDDLVRKSRTLGFGDEVKIRIMLGTFVLRSGFQEEFYTKAQKVRTAIRNDFTKAFTACDLILMPAFPTTAFKHGDSSMTGFQQKLADKFTVSANLAGIPGLTIPAGVEAGLPVGMQFLAPVFEEQRLFDTARKLAQVLPVAPCPGSNLDWSL